MHGADSCNKSNGSSYERNQKVYKQLNEWIEKQFQDTKELDKQFSYIYSLTSEIESIFLQIGLQAGIMLATEFYNNKK